MRSAMRGRTPARCSRQAFRPNAEGERGKNSSVANALDARRYPQTQEVQCKVGMSDCPTGAKAEGIAAARRAARTRAGRQRPIRLSFASLAMGKSSALPRSHDGSALAAPVLRQHNHAHTPRVAAALSAALACVEQLRSLRTRCR
jgi:hypothetical protein